MAKNKSGNIFSNLYVIKMCKKDKDFYNVVLKYVEIYIADKKNELKFRILLGREISLFKRYPRKCFWGFNKESKDDIENFIKNL